MISLPKPCHATALALGLVLLPAFASGQSAPVPQVSPAAPTMDRPVQVEEVPSLPSDAVEPQVASDLQLVEAEPEPSLDTWQAARQRAEEFLRTGGPAIWAIAGLSVLTAATILWQVWRFLIAGVWARGSARRAVALWEGGHRQEALALADGRRAVLSRLAAATMRARLDLPDEAAREETQRVAKSLMARQGGGLRLLELIATIAPLLGLLGTVLGMIAAFQSLQEAGSRADPALLAGGIWEALLTTAAGMAVAIPASVALTWFEAVIDRLRADMEDLAARIFVARSKSGERPAQGLSLAAE